MFVSSVDIDSFIENNLNVLFIGEKGCGKSAIALETFERHGLRYQYFSGGTLDPWVDFVGIPDKKETPNGPVIDLIRPQQFQNDEIDIIFFDEINRAKPKTLNALMELIQFKSINGKKFKNLRAVWGAMNPKTDEYTVEDFDAAQIDRFHVHINVPYKPDPSYFIRKYGPRIANAAIEWWSNLGKEVKKLVSPRRLDYAIDALLKNVNIEYILPEESNPKLLAIKIGNGSTKERLLAFINNNATEEMKKFLLNENNYNDTITHIVEDKVIMQHVLPQLPQEKTSTLISEYDNVLDYVVQNTTKSNYYNDLVTQILTAKQNQVLINKIKKLIDKNDNDMLGVLVNCSDINLSSDFLGDRASIATVGKHPKNKFSDVYPKMLNNVKSVDTDKRRSVLPDIRNCIYENMPTEDIVACLQIVNELVKRSQNKSINEFDFETINWLFLQLFQQNNSNIVTECKNHKLYFILYKMQNTASLLNHLIYDKDTIQNKIKLNINDSLLDMITTIQNEDEEEVENVPF